MTKIFLKKNVEIFIQLFSVFIILWIIMFIIPNLFVFLFDSYIGNLILIGLIILTGIYNLRFTIGFAIIIIILYRFNYLSRHKLDGFIL